MFAVIFCAAALAASVAGQDTASQLWPMPQNAACVDGALAVASSFTVTTNDNSATLNAAISRYQKIYAALIGDAAPADPATALTSMTIGVTSGDETLGPLTNCTYDLSFSPSSPTVIVSAHSIYGAMAAMETFSQLFSSTTPGQLVALHCVIKDWPTYQHRGFLVDSGRRFIPVPLLQNMMDSMSYSKMNVLHLHISDWAGVRFEVPAYPELTSGLNGQFYTASDAAALVQYGKERGIRIVPEIDLPAHSSGFAPLIPRGVEFCWPNNTQLYNNPATNATLKVVTTVLSAVAAAFPDAVFHLGGDETSAAEGTICDYDSVHTFEKALQQAVQALQRQPAVWNEVWSDPPTTEPNGALPGTIIQNWHVSTSSQTTGAGFPTLVSTYSEFYLDQQCCAAGNAAASAGPNLKQCYWTDITSGVPSSGLPLLYGGEAAMWSDMYCTAPECPQPGPWAIWYGPAYDEEFSQSFANLAWPRASAAAGSFWNYQASLDPTSTQFATIISNHNARLTARGSITCPNGCYCDWNSKCGKPYGNTPGMSTAITLINQANYKIKINAVTPCVKGHQDTIVTLAPGQQAVVTQDFIAEGPTADGDPFDVWFGGPGWMDFVGVIELRQDPSSSTYIDYVVVSQN